MKILNLTSFQQSCKHYHTEQRFDQILIFTIAMQIINLTERWYIIFIKLLICSTNSVYIEEYKVNSIPGSISKKYKLCFES